MSDVDAVSADSANPHGGSGEAIGASYLARMRAKQHPVPGVDGAGADVQGAQDARVVAGFMPVNAEPKVLTWPKF